MCSVIFRKFVSKWTSGYTFYTILFNLPKFIYAKPYIQWELLYHLCIIWISRILYACYYAQERSLLVWRPYIFEISNTGLLLFHLRESLQNRKEILISNPLTRIYFLHYQGSKENSFSYREAAFSNIEPCKSVVSFMIYILKLD